MGTIIKHSADGLILRKDNNFDTNLRKVFINNHEITDINTFFKVAEENTRLLEQVKKQKEVINKAMSILKDNFVYDYVRSCDTTDGVGYDEIDTEYFTYRVYEMLKEVSE